MEEGERERDEERKMFDREGQRKERERKSKTRVDRGTLEKN